MCRTSIAGRGGRYNPNYGLGIHKGNAWKLTTVRGGEWASLKSAETGGACSGTARRTAKPRSKPTGDAGLARELSSAQKTGDGITKPELAQALAGKTALTSAERRTLRHYAKNQRLGGHKTFARQSTRQIALRLAQGMSIAEAGAQFGLRVPT